MMSSGLRVGRFEIDEPVRGSKNGAMTPEQKQQFAEILRTGRAKLNLNKVDFCKKAGITTNTLRALERGVQDPGQRTIDRIAAILGTTPAALTTGKRPIDTSDPLLADLNDEDLEVAQAFHHAPMRVKQRTLGVLQERGRGRGRKDMPPDATELARRLLALDPEKRHAIAMVIGEFELLTRDEETAAGAKEVTAPHVTRRGKVGA